MKKTLICAALLAASFTMVSCNQQNSKMDDKPIAQDSTQTAMKIAYVEVDSLMSQYNFCKEYSEILQKKGQNIQNTLQKKGQALQNAANNFSQKLQQNAYTREQAEGIQANLARQDKDLQALQARLTSEFQAEQEKFNKALRDSLQSFLARYNKDKHYSLILSKAGDNLLYADKAYDITADVINGLNKAYKPVKKTAADKKDDKAAAPAKKK